MINSPKARTVQVSVEFNRIGEIDTMSEKYQAEITVHAKWHDPERLSTYEPKVHWNPELVIENLIQVTDQEVTHRTEDSNGTIVNERRKIRGVFWEKFELHNFPVDIQELNVTVMSKLDSNSVHLSRDGTREPFIDFRAKRSFVDQQKWRLFKTVKIAQCEPATQIVATCYCHRRPGYYIFNGFFLIFLITTTALNVFSIDCRLLPNRLSSTYTSLLTSISFRWVVNRSLPTVSYLTSLDKYAILCIFYICSLAVWHSIVGNCWSNETARIVDKWAFAAFGIVFFLINLWILVWFRLAFAKIKLLSNMDK